MFDHNKQGNDKVTKLMANVHSCVCFLNINQFFLPSHPDGTGILHPFRLPNTNLYRHPQTHNSVIVLIVHHL